MFFIIKKDLDSGVLDKWRKPILTFKDFLGSQALCEHRSTATLNCEM